MNCTRINGDRRLFIGFEVTNPIKFRKNTKRHGGNYSYALKSRYIVYYLLLDDDSPIKCSANGLPGGRCSE